jgi:tetratricopeptide (TPR) repeat protein
MGDGSRRLDLGDTPSVDAGKIASGWDYLSEGGLIRCVFSSTAIVGLGMGATSQKHASEVYWFIEQVDEELFEARKINLKNVPAGNAETIPLRRLLNEFTPRLERYEETVLPAMLALQNILDRGDAERTHGRLYSAELEYDRALNVEERNVRALFGLGLIFLTRREHTRARTVLAELVNVKAAFDGKNQHLFNEFGISLRKSKLFNDATAYYRRALDFVQDDENLYYNLARARYEQGDWVGCLEGLIASNRLNPDLGLARNLFNLIIGLAEDERLLDHYNKPPVPRHVADRARQVLAAGARNLPLDEQAVVYDLERGRARNGLRNDTGRGPTESGTGK